MPPRRRTTPPMMTAAPHMLPESLECRRLYAAQLLASRTLEITGTEAADVISVNRIPRTPNYTVEINGETSTFPVSGVQRIFAFGLGGNDIIRIGLGHFGNFGGSIVVDTYTEGGDGDDRITTDMGADTLVGGPGNDFLAGYRGSDRYDGGDGNDEIIMQIGRNSAIGGPGNDTINATAATRVDIDAGDGDDNLIGTNRADVLRGGPGNDKIQGLRGNDRIFGDDGDDTIVINSRGNRVEGGPGADNFQFALPVTPRVTQQVLRDFNPAEDRITQVSEGGPVT